MGIGRVGVPLACATSAVDGMGRRVPSATSASCAARSGIFDANAQSGTVRSAVRPVMVGAPVRSSPARAATVRAIRAVRAQPCDARSARTKDMFAGTVRRPRRDRRCPRQLKGERMRSPARALSRLGSRHQASQGTAKLSERPASGPLRAGASTTTIDRATTAARRRRRLRSSQTRSRGAWAGPGRSRRQRPLWCEHSYRFASVSRVPLDDCCRPSRLQCDCGSEIRTRCKASSRRQVRRLCETASSSRSTRHP